MGPGRLDERSTDRYGDRAGDRGSHARRGANSAQSGGYPPRSRTPYGESYDDEPGGYDKHDVEATFSEMEKELDKLRTARDDALTDTEDLRYQIEVLRSKLHEQRRLAAQPRFDNISGQVEQMLRNAQIQADQVRAAAERELRESRAKTARLLEEAAHRSAELEAEWHTEVGNRRQSLDRELTEKRQQAEAQVNEMAAWPRRSAPTPRRTAGGSSRRPAARSRPAATG